MFIVSIWNHFTFHGRIYSATPLSKLCQPTRYASNKSELAGQTGTSTPESAPYNWVVSIFADYCCLCSAKHTYVFSAINERWWRLLLTVHSHATVIFFLACSFVQRRARNNDDSWFIFSLNQIHKYHTKLLFRLFSSSCDFYFSSLIFFSRFVVFPNQIVNMGNVCSAQCNHHRLRTTNSAIQIRKSVFNLQKRNRKQKLFVVTSRKR